MALFREQPEPHMFGHKRNHSYKWWKKQMNKWLRIKNKKIEGEDAPRGYKRKQWLGWEW